MARSMLNLDLGLSDDDDNDMTAPRRQSGRVQREESVSDLLSGKDPTLMFGGESTRRAARSSFQFDMSGGGDPLDMLKSQGFHHQASASSTARHEEPDEMDDEELAFQMEFQRAMGGDSAPAPTRGRGRQTPSPAPGASGGDASDESLADIMGDILDDKRPAKRNSPSPMRRQTSPPSFAASGAQGDLTDRGGHPDFDEPGRDFMRGNASEPTQRSAAGSRRASNSPTPREDYSPTVADYEPAGMARGAVRGRRDASMPPSEREGSVASERSLRGSRQQESMLAGDESLAYGRDASSVSAAGRPPRKLLPRPQPQQLDAADPLADILGDDTPSAGPRGASRTTASPAMSSGAEARGLSTPGPATPTPTARGSTDGGMFDVELNVKPKRRLSMAAKAKASPAPSAPRTPTPEDDVPARAVATPNSGRATPPAASSAPVQGRAYPDEGPPGQGSRSATPRLPMDDQAPMQQHSSPSPSLPDNDDELDDSNDLFPDNSAPPPRRPASPAPESAPPMDDQALMRQHSSDDELPDFLLAGRGEGRRLRRGEQAAAVHPKAAPKVAPKVVSPKSAAIAADLGLSAEDMMPSDHSASLTEKQTGAAEDASGSASALLDIPLSVKPRGGRRMPKAKAKGLEDDLLGSASESASVSPSAAYASNPGRTQVGTTVGITGAGFQVSNVVGRTAVAPAVSSVMPLEQAASPRHPALLSNPGQAAIHPALPQGVTGQAAMHSAGLPAAALPRSFQPADGVPPGSPLTQTVQSESGSFPAHYHHDPSTRPFHQAEAAGTRHPAGIAPPVSPLPSARMQSTGGFGAATPASEPVLSLNYGGQLAASFALQPPVTAVPSADLLTKLAYSEAKVRQLELQLEDCEQRWMLRVADGKAQSEAEHERMELQCHQLESQLERCKEVHAADMRHLNEKKQLMLQNFEMEKDHARRDERRRAQLDIEKLRQDHSIELEEIHRRHERALSISQQQADMEADNLRNAHTGEHQLARLVEQVQGSVAEVERMSRRVDSDKTLEWSVRERQLDAREKTAREMEARLSAQSKEVENQRVRVSELLRHMEDSTVDDRDALKMERERLQDEHNRLLALQQSVRDADRNNKEAMKHAWAQQEDEKHSFQQERLRIEGELQQHREETELLERQQRQEAEHLKNLHNQVELARQNAARRIRETEATIAIERRGLMGDIEMFEEKRRTFTNEVMAVEDDKKTLSEEREHFEQEVRNVGQMAAEVQRRSEELKGLHVQAGEARGDILRLRDQLSEERNEHGSELERLKTMQTLVEQQRLQLLQTENQFRMRGIEDIDLMVTTQANFPSQGFALGVDAGIPANPFGVMEDPSAPFAKPAARTAEAAALYASPGLSMPATAGRIGSMGQRLQGTSPDAAGGSSRMELQTLLRRTKEASGDVLYIQEQFRFLQQSHPNGPMRREDRPFPPMPPPSGHLANMRPQPDMISAGMLPAQRWGMHQPGLGGASAVPAPSYSSYTDDDFAGPTLEGMRPLSSHISSAGSGTS